MARLFGICVPTMKSYLKRKGMRINQEDRHFRCDASKILRCGELMKMGYSEKESITMSMLKIGSGVISEIQVRNEPRTTRKTKGPGACRAEGMAYPGEEGEGFAYH